MDRLSNTFFIEQHGPHLPVGCDTFIGTDIDMMLVEELNRDIPTLIMPTVWAGYSPIASRNSNKESGFKKTYCILPTGILKSS